MPEKKIDLAPVTDSKVLKGMGYDQDSNTLRVQFMNGDTYDHEGVPLEKYASLTGADSTGKFYNNRIKSVYPSRKLK